MHITGVSVIEINQLNIRAVATTVNKAWQYSPASASEAKMA